METLNRTMIYEPFCVKSTCISCKKYQNNNDHIRIEDYYVCRTCFTNFNIKYFRDIYYSLLETDNSDYKSLFWIKCKCKKVFEFEISGLKLLGLLDYNQIICECQKK